MRRKQINHKIDGIFVLLLFALLAGSLLLVLLSGAGSYQRLAARDAESYARSTTLQYMATKLRHADRAGAISVGYFPGTEISTLQLTQEIDGARYVTLIYAHEGSLRELFTGEDTVLPPTAGSEIMPCLGLEFAQEDGLLRIRVETENGQESALRLGLRSGGRSLG